MYLLVKVFSACFSPLHKTQKISSYRYFSGYRIIKSAFNSCSRCLMLLKVMVDNTHGCENGKFRVINLLIQARTHMQVVLNLVVSLCLMSYLLRTGIFVEQESFNWSPKHSCFCSSKTITKQRKCALH